MDIEMLAGAAEVLELHQDALQERDTLDVFRTQVVGRLVFCFLVGFDAAAEPDRVRAACGGAVVLDNARVEVVGVLPGREALFARCHRDVERDALRNDDEPAEVGLHIGDSDRGEVDGKTEELLVKFFELMEKTGG